MKVVQINAVYKNQSTGRSASDMHDFFVAHGVICKTVYGLDKGDYPDTYYLGNLIDHKLHALKERISGKFYYYSKGYTNKLIAYLERERPDVVRLGNLHSNFVSIPRLLGYLRKKNIPTIVTLDDCFYYTGGCTHYTANGCYKWKDRCLDCQYGVKGWLFDRTQTMFDDKRRLFGGIEHLAVVGVSDWIAGEAKKSSILRNAKIIKRIYNGIDLSVFAKKGSDFKKAHCLENKKIILGVASGWSGKKGLNVFNSLADMLPPEDIIVLVGDSKEECVNSRILHIPATDNVQELVSIYNAADVFLQASLEETFGKVVAEALACGTPVVTNAGTANPELVGDGCGMVVKLFEPDRINEAIQEILAKGKDTYSDACARFAKANFDNNKNLAEWLDLCKILIEDKAAS